MESREGDLRSVEEACTVLVLDSIDEHPVRDAGDEIADTLVVKERGHGGPVGGVSPVSGEDFVFAFAFRYLGLVAASPCVAAPRDGWVCERGA